MNGKVVVQLIPENEEDMRELDELDRCGLLDRHHSFGDWPNSNPPQKEDAG